MKSSNMLWLAVPFAAVAVFLTVEHMRGGLTLTQASPLKLQVGEMGEFAFTLTNRGELNGKDLRELTVEFIDDKWLVRTVNASVDRAVLGEGESAVIRITLEGAKAGVNEDARVRLTYPGGGREFRVRLTVEKDPESNLTFRLSSLSPVELLAFSERCGGG
jgi:hypothetical protein